MVRKRESGQALVLVLLSLSVVLTIVLYILSRSITDVTVSSNQGDSVRAFSAAEAGVEQALVTGTSILTPAGFQNGNATYTTSVTNFALGGSDVPFPSPLASGDIATVWFTSHDANGNLVCGVSPCFHGTQMKVCWGNTGTSAIVSTTPAVELSIYYENPAGSLAGINVARALIDPNAGRRVGNANILAPDAGTCTIGTQTYQFQKTITFTSLSIPGASYNNVNGLQFAKIRMMYNTDTSHVVGATVNFAGNTTLPSQGQRIDSSGVAGSSNRRIVVYQGWPEFPFSSNSIYSPVEITQ